MKPGDWWTKSVTLVEADSRGVVRFRDDRLDAPLRWRKPRIVAIWNDLFHERVTDGDLCETFRVMQACPQHRFVVLTKRIARAAEWINGAAYYPNVWLGTSAENQETFDQRAPYLAQLAGAGWNTVLSAEPLLGSLNVLALRNMLGWLVCGGETGAGAQPSHPNWFRDLRDQCQAAGVPFWFKGWGEWAPAVDNGPLPRNASYVGVDGKVRVGDALAESDACMIHVPTKRAGRILDGRTWDERPEGMRV
jgi:protein gp37